MFMSRKIVVIPGDGIGSEITDSAVAVLKKVSEKYNLDLISRFVKHVFSNIFYFFVTQHFILFLCIFLLFSGQFVSVFQYKKPPGRRAYTLLRTALSAAQYCSGRLLLF